MSDEHHLLSKALYRLLIDRRILMEVARRSDINMTELNKELNPKTIDAKLGIDSFAQLCKAIREIGYGDELDIILKAFLCKDNRSN